MKEVLLTDDVPLYYVPKGEKIYGIVLPCSNDLTKDGLANFYHPEVRDMSRRFKLNRVLGEYLQRYGRHVFYLGTFKSENDAIFRFFSFPVKHRNGDECDLTIIQESCQDLVGMCKRYNIDVSIMPMLDNNMDYAIFHHCYKTTMDLLLGDNFIVIHRRN